MFPGLKSPKILPRINTKHSHHHCRDETFQAFDLWCGVLVPPMSLDYILI